MKALWIILTLMSTNGLLAQTIRHSPQIVRLGANPFATIQTDAVQKVDKNEGGKNVLVWYKFGAKSKVNKDSIWGLWDNKGQLFRYYHHLFYKVADTTNGITYQINRGVFFGRVIVSKTFIYSSKTLTSDLYQEVKHKPSEL